MSRHPAPAPDKPLIVFYNGFFGAPPDLSGLADDVPCRFSGDRRLATQADAVVFHLPRPVEFGDARKRPGQLWVGWSMESKAHTRVRHDAALMRNFDLLMSFERASDVWCSYLPSPQEWRDALAQPPAPKTQQRPAMLLQSAATDASGRNAYARALMRHLPVDSYGRFLHNRDLPRPDRGSATKMALLRSYRFCLAFENTVEPDYVTEKFFQPLLAGTVPVYRGAPNVDDFAPGDGCYIDASRFDSPRALAHHLLELAADEQAYARLLAWRSQPLRPSFQRLQALTEVTAFARLAEAIRQRLSDRAPSMDPPHTARPPFGWPAYVRTRSHRTVAAWASRWR